MTITSPRLITPPPEKEEVYPYRRVWRSLLTENGVLALVTAVVFVVFGLLGAAVPTPLREPLNLLLALLPLLLWGAFSWLAEGFSLQPRRRLVVVLILSALAANAVGVPLVEQYFQVDRWLPLASAVERLVGYSFTVGITQELCKYLVLRYAVFPHELRVWHDGIAYGAASAVGYATVLNLHYVLSTPALSDAVAIRVFGALAIHTLTGMLLGYGLSDTRFNVNSMLILPLSVALAALIGGVFIPVRAGLVNASLLLLEPSAATPLLGFAFVVGLFAGLSLVLSFFFDNADRRHREAVALRED